MWTFLKKDDKRKTNKTLTCYDFILWNVYFDFVDIFWNFGLKPYLTTNANEICLQLPLFLCAWFCKTANENTYIANISPAFQALTKSTGKVLDKVHALKVLHRRDIHNSPLLPATWAIIVNIISNVDKTFFSSNMTSILKKGKIRPGITQYTLGNVLMIESMEPPYEAVTLHQIYVNLL